MGIRTQVALHTEHGISDTTFQKFTREYIGYLLLTDDIQMMGCIYINVYEF